MNKSLKIVLMGYGKMGKAIENIALSRGHKMVQVFSSKSPATSPDAIPAADIIIEFTRPETAYKNLELSIKSGTPVITGTTGWLERLNEIEILCAERDGTFLYSSNFSIGMNVFFEINQLLARLMNKTGDYRASMEERHHIQKKDKPSGTAVTLAQQIINESSRISNWTLEQGQTNTELPIKVVREGDIKGFHSIEYRSDIDRIRIEHEAFSREGFAMGAVMVAEWIVNKKGVFRMEDYVREVLLH
jgi:4-hydroxy-tetrahydrodipicolinate reductase